MKKILIVLIALTLLLTGCKATKDFEKAYNNMEVGSLESNINGYQLNIKLAGTYLKRHINTNVKVTNYMNEDYQVVVDDITYYLIDDMKYRTNFNKTDFGNLSNSKNEELEEIDTEIPFLNIDDHLEILKNKKADDNYILEEIDGKEYKVYTYNVSKKESSKVVKFTALKDVEFTSYIPAKVWLDSNNYVYKLEYDLGSSLNLENSLIMTVTYNKIDNIKEIKLNDMLKTEKEQS